jgi:hypothetical protein
MMRTQLHCTLGSTCYPKRGKTLDVRIGSASVRTREPVATGRSGGGSRSRGCQGCAPLPCPSPQYPGNMTGTTLGVSGRTPQSLPPPPLQNRAAAR